MKIEKPIPAKRFKATSVQFTEAQRVWLKSQAQKNGVCVAHVVRACIDQARCVDAEKRVGKRQY